MSRRFMIKIISRLRTRKSTTLVPVFCPWGQKMRRVGDGGCCFWPVRCRRQRMRRVWDAGFCADFGCGVCLPLKAANAARKLQKAAAKRRCGLFMIPMPHLPRPAANRPPHPNRRKTHQPTSAAFAASGSEQARSNILRPPPAAFSAPTGRKQAPASQTFASADAK